MVASISSSTVNNWTESLFNKLDTKKQGFVDQSDLADALGPDEAGSTANSDDAADMLKQFDGDNDGKITKSELSTAISKVADELNAQLDSSRVDKSRVAATGENDAGDGSTEDDDTAVSDTGLANIRTAPAARGGAAPAAAASSAEATNKYVQAADTDSSGEVSDDEAAAYKKLMAKQAETKAQPQPGEGPDSDKDLARALDLLKQYVDHSGGGGSTTASGTVDTSA